VGEGHTLESDRYIIDVDQLEDVGGAPVPPAVAAVNVISSSSNHMVPMSGHLTKNVHTMPTNAHMISTSSHMTSRRSGGDIIKLLKMTSPDNHPSNYTTSSFDVGTTPSSQSG